MDAVIWQQTLRASSKGETDLHIDHGHIARQSFMWIYM